MTKTIIILGLTLFALFFGAGNLIFPIKLGWESGSFFSLAILGFLMTGVGMPLLGLIAGSTSPGGMPQIIKEKVSQWFSILFMVVIYLTIGPLFAIPRTATTSYTIGIVPNIGHDSNLFLLIYSIIYFSLVLFLSLNPTKIVETIGKFLTPLLLFIMGILCILSFFKLNQPITEIKGIYLKNAPFPEGFIEGYLTMDAIASIAFSIIAITTLKAMEIIEKRKIFKYATLAAIIAGIGLVIIYIALGWVGNHYPLSAHQITWINENQVHEGAYILSHAANSLMGFLGPVSVSIVVTLACLTTAIGLIVALSGFFFNLLHPYLPNFKYNFYVYFFTLMSLILSNQGLNQVIKASIPILTILYPIAILIIFLVLLSQVISIPKIAFKITVYVTSCVSISGVLFTEYTEKLLFSLYKILNIDLSSLTFAWIAPAFFTLLIGYLIAHIWKID